MKNLSIWLPPFAGDYSGACSALFDYNALIVLIDAACCTRNYVEYEEPRWTRGKKTTFSAQLRTVEAVLGDDARILGQAEDAARELRPEFIALLGSPVPAVTGMDLSGMAYELEGRTGLPCIGLDTTGFRHYDSGVSDALLALLHKFGEAAPTIPSSVNLLGLTPMDFSANGNASDFVRAFEDQGCQVLWVASMNANLAQIRQAPAAERNVVLSWSGLAMAKEMERAYGIPYITGVPISANGAERMTAMGNVSKSENPSVLIVSEQILGNSLRRALYDSGCEKRIAVASFFGWETALAQPGDRPLSGEAELETLLQNGAYETVIGDPLLELLPAMKGCTLRPLAHPAVSGNLHWNEVPRWMELSEKELVHWSESL